MSPARRCNAVPVLQWLWGSCIELCAELLEMALTITLLVSTFGGWLVSYTYFFFLPAQPPALYWALLPLAVSVLLIHMTLIWPSSSATRSRSAQSACLLPRLKQALFETLHGIGILFALWGLISTAVTIVLVRRLLSSWPPLRVGGSFSKHAVLRVLAAESGKHLNQTLQVDEVVLDAVAELIVHYSAAESALVGYAFGLVIYFFLVGGIALWHRKANEAKASRSGTKNPPPSSRGISASGQPPLLPVCHADSSASLSSSKVPLP